jgi:hypothetical protein
MSLRSRIAETQPRTSVHEMLSPKSLPSRFWEVVNTIPPICVKSRSLTKGVRLPAIHPTGNGFEKVMQTDMHSDGIWNSLRNCNLIDNVNIIKWLKWLARYDDFDCRLRCQMQNQAKLEQKRLLKGNVPDMWFIHRKFGIIPVNKIDHEKGREAWKWKLNQLWSFA